MLVLALATAAPPAFPVSSVPLTAPTPEAFLPPGWALVDFEVGDLTGDGVPDHVFLLEPECASCEADKGARALLVIESFGSGWMRVGVADWGDASMAARVDSGQLVVTTGRTSTQSERSEVAKFVLERGRFQLVWRVVSSREEGIDGPIAERITEDWKLHERVVERGTPLSFHHKETFTGSRSLEETPSGR